MRIDRKTPIISLSNRTLSRQYQCKALLDSQDEQAQDEEVIESFKHKGLVQFFDDDDRRKLPASQVDKIGRILARLNEAMTVQNMGLPGYRLHPLKGELAGF